MSDTEKHEELNIYKIKMHRWRMAFFGLVILLAGIVIGAAASLLIVWRIPIGPMPGPEHAADRMIQGLRHELRLTPEQREKIEPIVREHLERLDQIRKNARPLIEAELGRMNEQILPILDDQQRQQWVKMQKHLPIEPPIGPPMPFRPPQGQPQNRPNPDMPPHQPPMPPPQPQN